MNGSMEISRSETQTEDKEFTPAATEDTDSVQSKSPFSDPSQNRKPEMTKADLMTDAKGNTLQGLGVEEMKKKHQDMDSVQLGSQSSDLSQNKKTERTKNTFKGLRVEEMKKKHEDMDSVQSKSPLADLSRNKKPEITKHSFMTFTKKNTSEGLGVMQMKAKHPDMDLVQSKSPLADPSRNKKLERTRPSLLSVRFDFMQMKKKHQDMDSVQSKSPLAVPSRNKKPGRTQHILFTDAKGNTILGLGGRGIKTKQPDPLPCIIRVEENTRKKTSAISDIDEDMDRITDSAAKAETTPSYPGSTGQHILGMGRKVKNLKRNFQILANTFRNPRESQEHPTSQEALDPQSETKKEASQSAIVIVGGPGTGKSSLGNFLLHKKTFVSNSKLPDRNINVDTNQGITVYDVPSRRKPPDKKEDIMMKHVNTCRNANVAIIFTLAFSPDQDKEEKLIKWIKDRFSEHFLRENLYVAITNASRFKNIIQQKRQTNDPIQQQDLLEEFKKSEDYGKFWKAQPAVLQEYCQEKFFLIDSIDDEEDEQNRRRILQLLIPSGPLL